MKLIHLDPICHLLASSHGKDKVIIVDFTSHNTLTFNFAKYGQSQSAVSKMQFLIFLIICRINGQTALKMIIII